jgi:uncharacterized membrane protein
MSVIGIWKKFAPESLEETIFMKFESDGMLTYQIHLDQKIQQFNLTYRIVDNQIVSDQPSKPKEERTDFFFEGDDILVLIYNGEPEKYSRESTSLENN